MTRPEPRAGFALVAVLWTIALLTVLALGASLMFRGFAGVVAIGRDASKADALLSGGLEYAAAIVRERGDRPLFATTRLFLLGSGAVRVALSDDGGRININKAPAPVLASLFAAVGASGTEARMIAQAIVAWRVRNGVNPLNTASASGNDVQVFTDPRQLARVPGIRADYLTAIAPLATAFGEDRVNGLTAPPAVLGAIPGLSGSTREALLAARQQGPQAIQRLVSSLGSGGNYLRWKGTPIARADLTVTLPDGYAKTARAVIVVLVHDDQPYRILAWTPAPLESE
jgi:general secretion pathway protein K